MLLLIKEKGLSIDLSTCDSAAKLKKTIGFSLKSIFKIFFFHLYLPYKIYSIYFFYVP